MPKRFPQISIQQGKHIVAQFHKLLTNKIYVVGSIRRELEFINDIDIIVIIKHEEEYKKIINKIDKFIKLEKAGSKIITGVHTLSNNHKVQIDLFLVYKEELPYALLQYTGPKTYNLRLRRYVKEQLGWRLNQYGLFYQNSNEHVKGTAILKTEKQVINFIGTTYYHPRDRK